MHLTPSTVTIAPSEGITRWQTPGVLEALQTRRVVILEGARQCGKTTLAKSLKTAPGAIYRTLDDVALHAAARADPHGFVAHGAGLMVIDEIQRAPELLQAIKKEVDENPVPAPSTPPSTSQGSAAARGGWQWLSWTMTNCWMRWG